jgi:hypothetical protein
MTRGLVFVTAPRNCTILGCRRLCSKASSPMNSFLQVEIIADNKSKQIDISHLLKKKQLTKQTESAKVLKNQQLKKNTKLHVKYLQQQYGNLYWIQAQKD